MRMKISLGEQEKFTKQLSALLTEKQYDFLCKTAEDAEVSLGELVRTIIDIACTALILERKGKSHGKE